MVEPTFNEATGRWENTDESWDSFMFPTLSRDETAFSLLIEREFQNLTKQVRPLSQRESALVAQWFASGVEDSVIVSIMGEAARKASKRIRSLSYFEKSVADRFKALGWILTEKG